MKSLGAELTSGSVESLLHLCRNASASSDELAPIPSRKLAILVEDGLILMAKLDDGLVGFAGIVPDSAALVGPSIAPPKRRIGVGLGQWPVANPVPVFFWRGPGQAPEGRDPLPSAHHQPLLTQSLHQAATLQRAK